MKISTCGSCTPKSAPLSAHNTSLTHVLSSSWRLAESRTHGQAAAAVVSLSCFLTMFFEGSSLFDCHVPWSVLRSLTFLFACSGHVNKVFCKESAQGLTHSLAALTSL